MKLLRHASMHAPRGGNLAPALVLALALAGLAMGCGGDGPQPAGPFVVASPDGRLEVTLEQRGADGPAGGADGVQLHYRATLDGVVVLDWSPLGLRTADRDLVTGLRFVGEERRDVQEAYTMVVGKRLQREVVGRELTLRFEHPDGTPLAVVVRAHDDGLAFRYVLGGEGSATMRDEATGFSVPGGSRGWMASYDELGLGLALGAYENSYEEVAAGDPAPNEQGFQFPALFELAEGGTFVLLTESDLDGSYCGTRLAAEAPGGTYRIRFPSPEEGNGIGEVEPTSDRPWTLPWRVAIVGDLPTVVGSTLVDDLARSSTIEDTSWITPGRVAWSWFSQGTGDLALQQEYLTFAEEMGWEHLLIDAEWDQWPDATTTVPAFVSDAVAAGVGVQLWYNSGGEHAFNRGTPLDRMLEGAREAEMAMLESWGVAGVKIDFFNSDKQDRIQQYMGILEDAAAHRLLVNFHGATLPRGWQRTYPNLMTHEAVRGAEYVMFGGSPSAIQRVRYVFTRNVVGSMDYTPVTFEASLSDAGVPYAGELALAVAFESGLQHFAGNADLDTTTGYRAVFADAPFVRTFMENVPAVWDETVLVAGHPDSHAVIARRRGTTWYLAAVSGQDGPLPLDIPLDFLEAGDHPATFIRQGAAPDAFAQETTTVTSVDTLQEELPPRSGLVAVLE